MPMSLVQNITVGVGGTTAVEFTNIPATGKDLMLLVASRAENINGRLTFNNNSANYAWRDLWGNGSTVSSGSSSGTFIQILALHEPRDFNGTNNTVGIVSNATVYISNYAVAANKMIGYQAVTEINANESYQVTGGGKWSNTAAISSLKIESNSGNILELASISLYIIS